MGGDDDTIKDLCGHLVSIFRETLGPEMLPAKPDDYFINIVMEAILLKSRDE